VTARAARNLKNIYRAIDAANAAQAHAWFNGLERAILGLSEHPTRGAAVPEAGNLRQLLYGRKPHIYRVIYAIDETRRIVTVLHIRHGARDALPSP
jgi:plasmid stabilization system protein ParE